VELYKPDKKIGNNVSALVNGEIKTKLLKEDERPVKSLTHTQTRKLLSAFKSYQTMKMRILLALCTNSM